MDGNRIYRLTEGEYTPSGRWTDDPNLVDYRYMANIAAKKIREMDDKQFAAFLRSSWTIWGGSLEIVNVRAGRVDYDAECEPREGKYIATAITSAIRDRRAQ